ncbi:MAG: hypothetical protein AYK18_05360 [Theionarchaea archaeon DG-70]|nr:MAG: hypothetical protein AYK18_05360 [Theionarchaea archaeon DG-70]
MEKIKITFILIICGMLILPIGIVHAFEIVEILTTSDIVDGEHQGEKIHFEPGESVYVYVHTCGHCSNCRMTVDLSYVLRDPSNQILEEHLYRCPGHEDGGGHVAYYYFDLPLSALPGMYTVEITMYDRNYNTKEARKLFFYVDYYTANDYVEEADLYFLNENYGEAKNSYEKAKEEYERFAAQSEIDYCREKIEECDKYILAEKHYSEGISCIGQEDYKNAVYYFMKAKDLYEVLGDNPSVEMCDYQIEDNRGIRLFFKQIFEIPSVANVSILIWIVCAYFFCQGLRKGRREFIIILAALAGIFSFILNIMFYFFYF